MLSTLQHSITIVRKNVEYVTLFEVWFTLDVIHTLLHVLNQIVAYTTDIIAF